MACTDVHKLRYDTLFGLALSNNDTVAALQPQTLTVKVSTCNLPPPKKNSNKHVQVSQWSTQTATGGSTGTESPPPSGPAWPGPAQNHAIQAESAESAQRKSPTPAVLAPPPPLLPPPLRLS